LEWAEDNDRIIVPILDALEKAELLKRFQITENDYFRLKEVL
jgi:hypothetical protein